MIFLILSFSTSPGTFFLSFRPQEIKRHVLNFYQSPNLFPFWQYYNVISSAIFYPNFFYFRGSLKSCSWIFSTFCTKIAVRCSEIFCPLPTMYILFVFKCRLNMRTEKLGRKQITLLITDWNDKYELSRISGYSMASTPLVSDLLTFTKMIFHSVNYTDNHQTLITPSKSCCRHGWPILIPSNSNKLSFRQHLVQKWSTLTLLFTSRKLYEHLVARGKFWLQQNCFYYWPWSLRHDDFMIFILTTAQYFDKKWIIILYSVLYIYFCINILCGCWNKHCNILCFLCVGADRQKKLP